LFRSREFTNFTYDLTPRNKAYLACHIAHCLNRPSPEIMAYIDELSNDEALRGAIINKANDFGRAVGIDPTAQFGRRLGWYALARAMKPRVIIETGVEKGLGSTVLCAALLRNRDEGHPGRYFGTDLDPGAGRLFTDPYREVGEILYGDSIESLQKLDETIDLFINDSDHSAEYEGREYRTIRSKLSKHAIIIGDNAHVTDELYQFSVETGRHFLFFREEPADHWYLGAGIGLSLPQDAPE
jgi:predicted O-methyltransferase YrrM